MWKRALLKTQYVEKDGQRQQNLELCRLLTTAIINGLLGPSESTLSEARGKTNWFLPLVISPPPPPRASLRYFVLRRVISLGYQNW